MMAAESSSSEMSSAASEESSAAPVSSSEEPAMAASSSEAPSAESPAETPVTAAKLPATGLSTDTLAAAPGNATEGFGYVGVWAVDAAGCAVIDQPAAKDFAVISTGTFRDGPKAYFGSFGALADGKLSITVRAAQGTRTIALEQTTPDALTIDGKAYLRCTL